MLAVKGLITNKVMGNELDLTAALLISAVAAGSGSSTLHLQVLQPPLKVPASSKQRHAALLD